MRVEKYSKKYTVKSHEADCHGFLRVLSLMNVLQDVAVEHAETLGLGLSSCLKQNLAWVGSNYLVQILQMPQENESFSITTWPAEAKLWGAIRDFSVQNEFGQEIIKASSQWVLIDVERRRPVMLKKHFPNYETVNERVIEADFAQTPTLTEKTNYAEFKVRFDDIDVNQHVNNAVYPLWASESLDNNFRLHHTPIELEIGYKKEALYGETIVVYSQQKGDESLHSICNKANGDELAWCRIKWRQI